MTAARRVYVVAHRSRASRRRHPNVAILPVFAPARLVLMHDRPTPELCQQLIRLPLQLLPHAMRQFHDLAHAQVQLMQRGQIALYLAHR
jgi:hypothetical protein